ncbi:MAG TPA: TonB-dependent receptor [Vicinamibacterales bacterium]|nr:TonB-dependent receptor [Vicinamibacterales bacterium]
MKRGSVFLVAVMLLLAPALAMAQIEQGRIIGTVTDEQGAVLPGATVTAKSPALIGTRSAVAESDGRYVFPALPSGTYTLTYELPGFRTVVRENIVLSVGTTLTVDMQLQVATLQETVTVTGLSPVVDTSTTKVGTEFSGEKLIGIPTATDIWAALGQAPGVRMLGFDVGGSHKSQQSGYESFGIRNQNRVVNEGVDTTEGTGGAGWYADYFVNEEVAVSAAGADVEMNTPGSAVVQTTKAGGNTFKVLANITYEGDNFVGNNIDDDTRARGFTGQPNLIFWEGHADIGGPIVKDRVWFFGAYNHFKIDKVISGVARDIATDLGIFDNYTAKGTWKISEKDTAIGYYAWGRKQKPFRGLSAAVSPEAVLAQDSASWLYKGQWQRVWSNRFFMDAQLGLFGYGWPMEPRVDFQTNPPRTDTGLGLDTGAGWLVGNAGGPFNADRNKPQLYVKGTYFLPDKLGSHDLKIGYEWQDDQSVFTNNGNSGPILYRDRNGRVDEIRLTDYNTFESFGTDWTGNDDRNMRHAAYLQDRWSPNSRVTLTLGLRYERQRPHYEASIRKPLLTEVFEAFTSPAKTVLVRNTWMPRAGVSWDVTGAGNTVLKVFYGRYYYNFADRMDALNPGGTNRKDFKFLDQNGNRLYDGPHELGALVSSAGGSSTVLDEDLRVPYADEINAAFERQFWGESSIRAAYIRKMVRDEFATLNVVRDGQFTVPTAVTVGIRNFGDATATNQTFNLMDIPASLRGQVRNVVTNIPEDVGGGDYNYDTIQLAFNKRFGGGLFVQSSFDYQWRDELRQNSASTSPLNSDPLGVAYFQNANPAVSNRQESTNWQGRLMGRYVFPLGVGFAVNLRSQSGYAYSRLVTAPLPNAGTVTFFADDIDANRSDTATLLDIRVDKAFRFDRYKVTLMVDLFNATNSNAVTNFFLANGANYNRIIATLDPRTAMVGARFEF